VARTAPSTAAVDRFAAEWIVRFVDPNFAPHFRLGKSDAARIPAVEFARRLFGWHTELRSRVPPELAALLALAAAFTATTAPTLVPLLWVEKTPQNERYVTRFAPLVGARFIQLVRDPRATLASLGEAYRASGIGGFDVAQRAHAIGRSLRLAVENSRRWSQRYLVVRYEDLVEGKREIERVRLFLGIEQDPVLFVPTADGEPVRANSSFGQGVPGVIATPRRPESLGSEYSTLLSVYTARAARAFSYTIPGPGPIAQVALRVWHSPGHILRSGRAALGAIMRRHLYKSR
jgi:hypothetical protein